MYVKHTHEDIDAAFSVIAGKLPQLHQLLNGVKSSTEKADYHHVLIIFLNTQNLYTFNSEVKTGGGDIGILQDLQR